MESLNVFHLPTLGLIVLVILGLVIGRCINVIINFIPTNLYADMKSECLAFLEIEDPSDATQREQIPVPRSISSCPNCHYFYRWTEKIPLLSYLFLLGKCSKCRANLSIRVPVVELLSVVLLIGLVIVYGLNLKALLIFLFSFSLLIVTCIDLEHQLVPDSIVLPILWLGLIISTYDVFVSPKDAIIGAAIGYLLFWLLGYLYQIVRKAEGLGLGDAKLLAMISAWQGYELLPLTIAIAFIMLGIVSVTLLHFRGLSDKKMLIPFSPMLSIAGFVTFFWGETIFNYLLSY